MMKRIISFVVASVVALSLIVISVCAVGIEANAPSSAATIETTVAPTISEDYIPSGTPHRYNLTVDDTKSKLQEHLIICEYEKPANKAQAENSKAAAREYIAMVFEYLPPCYQGSYSELYLMAYPSIQSAYEVMAQYDKDIEAFEAEEAKAKAEAAKKKKEEKKKQQSNNSNKVEIIDGNLKSLGEFKLTAYCNCKKCCGKWAGGPTASGKMPKQGRTIAVDPKVIPLGSKVVINGITYIAEDTGSAIKNKRIDVYFDSHKEALKFGVQYAKVYVVID